MFTLTIHISMHIYLKASFSFLHIQFHLFPVLLYQSSLFAFCTLTGLHEPEGPQVASNAAHAY